VSAQSAFLAAISLVFLFFLSVFSQPDWFARNSIIQAGAATLIASIAYVLGKNYVVCERQLQRPLKGIDALEAFVVPICSIGVGGLFSIAKLLPLVTFAMAPLSLLFLAAAVYVLGDRNGALREEIATRTWLRITGTGWGRLLFSRYPPRQGSDLFGFRVMLVVGLLGLTMWAARNIWA